MPPAPAGPEPIHLKPAAPLAERVLLPGDPHRALAVAQTVLERPRMFNHHRGLWGYTGAGPDGEPVTVQSTGMGGPSAAIVVHELIELGARRIVRIGTCGALDPALELGDLVTVDQALATDGTSRALGAGDRVAADPAMTAALAAATGGPRGVVASADLFYDEREDLIPAWRAAGAVAVEMEAATVLRLAETRDVRAACVVAVSDLLGGTARVRASREQVEALAGRLGEAGLAALGG